MLYHAVTVPWSALVSVHLPRRVTSWPSALGQLRVNAIKELREIFAVQFEATDTPLFNEKFRAPDAEEAVMSTCTSLIAIIDREGHQNVKFSHFSVKEYLTSERLTAAEEHLSYYHILPEYAHTILAHVSLSVLLHLDDETDRDTIAHIPFALYAARHWVDHAQFRNVSSHIKEVMKRLFDPAKPHFAAWVWLYDIDRYWAERMPTRHLTQPEAVPLYYASLCGFVGLAEHLIAAHLPDVSKHRRMTPRCLHPSQAQALHHKHKMTPCAHGTTTPRVHGTHTPSPVSPCRCVSHIVHHVL